MSHSLQSSELSAITKIKLKADFEKMGLGKGDHVAVALSLKSIGFVEHGPEEFIDALLETVGSEGTVMMNTFTRSFPAAKIDSQYIFDPKTTAPRTGLVPQRFLKRKNAIRSRHPIFSVAAIGKLAEYLTSGHDENSTRYLPYIKLAQAGGKYMSIGLGDRLVAIRHEAQRRAGMFVIPRFAGVKYKTPQGGTSVLVMVCPPCARKLSRLVPKLERLGIIERGKVGMATSLIGSADRLIEAMATMLKEDPTLNLCDSVFCLECRELERKMNLYGRIKSPLFFQRSLLARQLLRVRNGLILTRWTPTSQNLKQNRKDRFLFFFANKLSIFLETKLPKILNRLTGL